MKKYLIHIQNIIHDIFYQWQILLLFEFIYKLAGGIFLFPFLKSLVQKTLTIAEIPYLYLENIKKWLTSPYTLPILFCCFILLGIYILYEISVLVLYFQRARTQAKITFVSLLRISFKQVLHAIKPKNWIYLIILLLFVPLTLLSLTPTTLMQVRIPEYFTDFFKEHGNLYYIYGIIMFILNIFVFYMIFTFPAFLIEKRNFFDAFKRSRELMKKRFIKTLVAYLVWWVSLVALFFLICGFFLLILIIRYYFLPDTKANATQFLLNYMTLKQYAVFIYHSFMFAGSMAFIMYMYQTYTGVKTNIIKEKRKTNLKTFVFSVAEVLIILLAIGFYFDYQGNIFYQYNIMEKPIEIAAHRAGTTFTPENTIPALNYAINVKAAYAEIDVQQSKDGQLYILHDTNFNRTAGINKNVWDVSSDEINTYDVGSYYDLQFKGTHVPTLEEMIRTANHKIKLMIELKKNGHEDHLEEKTIALIKKHHFEDQCVIASMDLDILKTVKELDSQLKTVYIAPVVFGNFYNLDFVDIFSVESTFVNKKMIDRLHEHNKLIFAWTVNKDSEMKRLLSMDLDGLVTDNPELAFYYKNQGKQDEFINELIVWMFPNSQT